MVETWVYVAVALAIALFILFYYVIKVWWKQAKKMQASITTCPAWYCSGLRNACQASGHAAQVYAEAHAPSAEERIMAQQPGWECGSASRHCDRCMMRPEQQ